jgi:amidase
MKKKINSSLKVLFIFPFIISQLIFWPAGCVAPSFRVEETTIADIHAAMEAGKLTAQELVQMYLHRIEAYDKQGPFINSIIMINPKAMEVAAELDKKYAKSDFVGSLHGIPVIVKDNYDTYDMPTTNGTLALKNSIPPDDSYQVRKLREAGAIILAKANLAEFASSGAYTVSSILPGYTRNPYDTRRTTAGSSGGTAAAIASNFAMVGLGTDTGSSIRAPSSHQCLVGIRSTMGLTSRDGIVPRNSDLDIGGPMARSVADAVAVLEVIAGYDAADPITAASKGKIPQNYSQFLDKDGLRGAKIGVLRQMFEEEDTDPEVFKLINQALEDMKAAGATIIDPLIIPNLKEIRESRKKGFSRLKYDFNNYLASRGPDVPYKTLEEIIESKDYHPFLRKSLAEAQAVEGVPEDSPKYLHNMKVAKRLIEAVLKAMDESGVDALVFPTFRYPPRLTGDLNTPSGSNNGLSPQTGFPAFTIPMGFTQGNLPAGLQLLGRPFCEPTLIRISYAYEQATKHRRSPESTPPLR